MGVLPTGSIGVSFSGSPLNDFLTSHLTYSMLQSIPICKVQSVWQESLYDLWCRKSTFAVLYPSSYGPVAYACGITTVNGAKTNPSTGTSKNNAGLIWDRATTHILVRTPNGGNTGAIIIGLMSVVLDLLFVIDTFFYLYNYTSFQYLRILKQCIALLV